MQFIKDYWYNLDQAKKRWFYVGGVGVAVVMIMFMATGTDSSSNKRDNQQETIRSILTDQDTRTVGLDSLSAKYKLMERENKEMQKQLDRLQQDLDREKNQKQDTNQIEREIRKLRSELSEVKRANKEAAKEKGKKETESEKDQEDQVTSEPEYQPRQPDESQFEEFSQSYDDYSVPSSDFDGEEVEPKPLIISTHKQYSKKSKLDEDEEEGIISRVPAGSIITGIIINGMDAPTSQGARKDPFPSVIRINKEAILPNRYTSDIRECFLLVSGYGDLSSERAYLRGEKISCVTDDGKSVIETALDSYAVGEDGKVGVRGRLVSKQGQMIAKSLMAGFMSGVSEAFNVNPVPVLNTNPKGQTEYQSVFSESAIQGGMAKGASKALDRIAQFYLEMADSMFPVVEVDAGRQIDVIVTNGTNLKAR